MRLSNGEVLLHWPLDLQVDANAAAIEELAAMIAEGAT